MGWGGRAPCAAARHAQFHQDDRTFTGASPASGQVLRPGGIRAVRPQGIRLARRRSAQAKRAAIDAHGAISFSGVMGGAAAARRRGRYVPGAPRLAVKSRGCRPDSVTIFAAFFAARARRRFSSGGGTTLAAYHRAGAARALTTNGAFMDFLLRTQRGAPAPISRNLARMLFTFKRTRASMMPAQYWN